MQNYFESELTHLEKEMRWLKTSAVKSGATITSAVESVDYSISLNLVSSTNANGKQVFILETEDSAIFTATLDVYYDDITNALGDTRRRTVQPYYLSGNKYALTILAWGNSSDRATLSGGGTVTITGKLTVTCTSNFTLEGV